LYLKPWIIRSIDAPPQLASHFENGFFSNWTEETMNTTWLADCYADGAAVDEA
jgi:hypothetical protein